MGSGIYPAAAQVPAGKPPRAALLPAEAAWTVTLPLPPSTAGAFDARHVYVPVGAPPADPLAPGRTVSDRIVALDRQTGEIRWSREIRTAWRPLAAHGLVFVAGDAAVHALESETGDERWQAPLEAPVSGAPVAAGGLVVVPTTSGIVAAGARDGAVVWRQSAVAGAGPVLMDARGDAIFATLPGSRMVHVSASDGRVVWDRTLSGELGPPAAGDGRVFAGSTANVLFALNADDGDVAWQYPAGADVVGAAVEGEQVFFVSFDNLLRALNRGNGNQRWKAVLGTRPASSPVAFGGIVVVFGLSPALAVFDAATGAPLGVYDAPAAAPLADPGVGDRRPAPPDARSTRPGGRSDATILIDPELTPFRVAIVAVTGDGRAIALRPSAMVFREPAPVPPAALPGRQLPFEPHPFAPPAH